MTSSPRPLPVLRAVTSVTTRTHCPYCAFQCGMAVTSVTAAETTVEVKPDPDFPVNRGQMCIKGFTSADLLDHPARLTAPLVRSAQGRLVPATWDAALDFVAERLLKLRATYGAAAVGAFGGGALTNEKAYLLETYVRVALGSPNVAYQGRYCMSSAAGGQN